ncbi:MAG: hypothetical protein U9R79_18760 [Armatimonadota bacterium]|nr:hypothetical protein [Armatimonadota bacterium]
MRRRSLRWLLAGLMMAAVWRLAAAKDAEPAVSISVEPREVTVGDILTATVEITWPMELTVDLPGDDAEMGDAEIRSSTQTVEDLPDGRRRAMIEYTLVLWEVGERTLKAPPVTWRSGDGKPHQAERPEATVTVRSVLPEGASDIRDIRGPKEIPLRPVHYLLAALPLLLLTGAIAGAVLLLRRRKGEEEPEEAAPPLPPAQEALLALDELDRENLPAAGEVKEHYVRLSWILRHYVERRWGIQALEETTGMLADSMRGSGQVDEEPAAHIVEVLRRADLAKFAKHRPAAEVAREDVERARGIVRDTRPRPEPERVEAVGGG